MNEQNVCRYCGIGFETEKPIQTFSYWNKLQFWCHKLCKSFGETEEAIECQTIDADCNDCKHYKRGTLEPKIVSKLKRGDGSIVDVVFQPQVFINGHCNKFNKPTLAFPNKWTGRICFEHRKNKI